jgi:nucleotide-binding universal stress UspA family protein
MAQEILVAVDFGEATASTVRHVISLARSLDLGVCLLHAIEYVPHEPYLHNAESWGALSEPAREELEAIGDDILSEGVDVRTEAISPGAPVDVIVETADESHVVAVAIGAAQKGLAERIFAGSTAEAVVRRSHTPVFIYHPQDPQALRSILCAIDYSSHSEATLESALVLARAVGVPLKVLHVVPEHRDGAGTADDLAELQEFLEDFESDEVEVTPIILAGDIDEQIRSAAVGSRADMLVVGSHSRGAISELFIGGTTTRMLRSIPCSLLVVKEQPLEL